MAAPAPIYGLPKGAHKWIALSKYENKKYEAWFPVTKKKRKTLKRKQNA